MRTLFFAQSDDAVRLAASLGCGLLLGGMSPELVQEQIDAFEADPNGILVATAPYETGWRSREEAHVFFLVGFPGYMLQAIQRAPEPRVLPPTIQQLKEHAGGMIRLSGPSLRTLMRGVDDEPEQEPQLMLTAPSPCPEPRREQDEYVCDKCHIRWDAQEDKPPCALEKE